MSQLIRFDLDWAQEPASDMPLRLDKALREDGFVQLHCADFDWQLVRQVFDQARIDHSVPSKVTAVFET